MQTITYTEYRMYTKELYKHIEQKVGVEWARDIEVYNMGDIDGIVDLGVNWPALGTVSTDKAREFANVLNIVAHEVETFPFNGYKVVFE